MEAELAVGHAPELPIAVFALARVRHAERRWKEADELYERLLALEPGDPSNHLAYAEALRTRGRRAEARTRLDAGLAADPEHVGCLAELADLDLEEGRLDDGERRAREALEIAPEDARNLLALARAFLLRGELDAAHDLVVQVLRADPASGGALHLIAAIKARRSWFLGLWWRYATRMLRLGDRQYVVLLGGYVVYRLAKQGMADAFGPETGNLVQVLWLAFAAWTWLSPAIFARRLREELAPVVLRKDF
jgi:tetratricopeptide (TPR) repeat protein